MANPAGACKGGGRQGGGRNLHLYVAHPSATSYDMYGILMPDVINEYQKWKQQGEDLRVQAKLAMETRFRDLLSEAVHIAEEYRADFGAALKPPPAVTAFRYKASAKLKSKKAAATAKPAAPKREPP